jgi:hypothetical protein
MSQISFLKESLRMQLQLVASLWAPMVQRLLPLALLEPRAAHFAPLVFEKK